MVQFEYQFNYMSISVFGKGKVSFKGLYEFVFQEGCVCVYAKHCQVDIHERKMNEWKHNGGMGMGSTMCRWLSEMMPKRNVQ